MNNVVNATNPTPCPAEHQSGHRLATSQNFDAHVRSLCSPRRLGIRHPQPRGEVSLQSLLHGCVLDPRTVPYRMERRVDKLPAVCLVEFGLAIQCDATGNLQPNTRTLACIEDIRKIEASNPEATGFDVESLRQGWEMGARDRKRTR